jgi:hypothetical protein
MEDAVRPRKRRGCGCGIVLLVLLALLAVDYFAYPGSVKPGGPSENRGENGLWIRNTWYRGVSPEPLEALAARVRDGGITSVYCHVRYLKPDGTLQYRAATAAKKLTAALHELAPDATLYAWIYIGNELSHAEGKLPPVELADPTVRAAAVREAQWLIEECGFDGIQWDYEICANRDSRLTALLDDTRHALPGVPVSVCTPIWTPWPVTEFYGWDATFFGAIAQRCDQLTVMNYDTAMVLPRWYVACTREQTAQVTRAVQRGNPDCRVFIGVPTYGQGAGSPSHIAHAENLRMALIGVRDGLTDRRAEHGTFAGVALFADYTTDEKEWALYRKMWGMR